MARFRARFRQRAPEWILSVGMIWWGIITLSIPGLFGGQPVYYPLELFMSQPFWGILAITIGASRCISLFVNGLWRPTAHLRAITALFSIFIWSSLLLASMAEPSRVLGIPTFSMLLALDILALWWAAGDARLADDIAKVNKR